MIDVRIEAVTTRTGRPLRPETPVSEAAQRLRDADRPALIVLEEESVAGLVTESDLVDFVAEGLEPEPVEAVMSDPVATVAPNESLVTAAEAMRAGGVRHLPVVEEGTYRGLVSASALAPYLSRRRLEFDREDDPIRVDADDGRGIRVTE